MSFRASAKLELFTVLKFMYLQEERLRNSEQMKYSKDDQHRRSREFVLTSVPGTSILLNDKRTDLMM
jgi:hypothetical protein